MAGEFGISADEVIGLLRTMDVPVRSHLSLLTDDQVSRIRARWEREKRVRAEKAQPVPAAAPRRRRTGAAPEAPVAEAAPEPVAQSVRRRRRSETEGDGAEVATEEVVAPIVADVTPEVAPARKTTSAATESKAAPDAATTAKTVEATTDAAPVIEKPRKVEVAAKEPPVAEKSEAAPVAPVAPKASAPSAPAELPVAESAASEPPVTPAPAVTASAEAAPTAPASPPLSPDRPRPRPVVPGAPRPRAGSGGTPNFGSARPIASAAPGGGLAQGQRRDDRRPGTPGGAGPSGGQGGQQGGAGGGQGQGAAASSQAARRGKKGKRGSVDQEAVSANISKTMTAMRGPVTRGRSGRRFGTEMREEIESQRVAAVERERKTVRVNEFITVSELAQILGISATQIVGFAFKTLALMVTINQRLDFDQIELIASEFGFQAVKESDYAADLLETVEADPAEDLRPRPPVVTIMGHVDHGKTSLLDYIRKANVVAGEAGGITQHIGAYHVQVGNDRQITFLDTPGHEAFTAMRARGAHVTDIVVIVIAADDQVMPQTVEAISHAKSAGVPIIIAINKIDLPTANIPKVKQDLLQHEVVLEEFGGTVLHSEISAKKGTGVSELLAQILLQADILELTANPSRRAIGSVVEAQLDQGKGPVATVLVQNGTLRVGDDYICGIYSGRVRALLDERGKAVKAAGPAIPVQILGLTGVPMAGDQLLVVEDASAAREIAQRRERLDREAKSRRTTRGVVSLEDFMSHAAAGQKRQLRLIIKADQGGPAEALADALGQLSNPEVQVEILHRGVGAIAESDILLAKASGAIIIGFHVRPDNNARAAAEREGVDIKLYRIIYEAVADVKLALEGMLRPESREVVFGEAQVRETFKVARVGVIAGCIVRSGNINRKGRMRVIRDGVEIYDGSIASLRRFKDDVNEVKEGYECGIGIENFNDVKIGDVFECYRTEEVARTLDQAAKS
jgi:translation initiation factor IF-2